MFLFLGLHSSNYPNNCQTTVRNYKISHFKMHFAYLKNPILSKLNFWLRHRLFILTFESDLFKKGILFGFCKSKLAALTPSRSFTLFCYPLTILLNFDLIWWIWLTTCVQQIEKLFLIVTKAMSKFNWSISHGMTCLLALFNKQYLEINSYNKWQKHCFSIALLVWLTFM